MKILNGLIIGLILGGALGAWFGFNYGRDAPLLSNPFVERTLADRLSDKANEIYNGTR